MELSSHQEGQIPISIPFPIPIPIPRNFSYGGHGHGHMIHHHHHHESAAAAAPHTLIHNNHLITSSAAPVVAPPPPQNQVPASINNNGSSIPTATNLDQEDKEEDEEEHEDHVNHVNVAYSNNSNNEEKVVNRSVIKYKECLKNHAAAMGGTATDGCGEFMPSGEEGTIEALNCSACNCHRNFHKKEIEGDHQGMSAWDFNSNTRVGTNGGRKVLLGHPNGHKNMSILETDALGFHTAANPIGGFLPSRTAPHHHHSHHHPHQMIMSYNNNIWIGGLMGSQQLPSESDEQEQDQLHHHHHGHGGGVNVASRAPGQLVNNNICIGGLMGSQQLPSESDEQEQDQLHHHHHGHGGGVNVASRAPGQLVKKRFRTKFTQEQKEKMFNFAEKVGWKIQKQEESVVQNFCHEIGVKRRVLKVWMHNNKYTLAKNKCKPPPAN